jgi:aryl-alcohol dehydrogenase-like predicted oxidoreductase
MNPYCFQSGVAITPWSPLARGILAGAYKGGFSSGSTNRSQGQDRTRTESLYHGNHVFAVADRVIEIASKYGKTPAQIALAWMINKPEITAPVVGVSKIDQLGQLVQATKIKLDTEDVLYLEELYTPVSNLLSIGYS